MFSTPGAEPVATPRGSSPAAPRSRGSTPVRACSAVPASAWAMERGSSSTTSRPLPFAAASFDLVICTLVLEHAVDLLAPLAAFARVVRSGGRVVVSDIHPAMRKTGTQANFTDPSSGNDLLPPSYAHAIADYLKAARAVGLEVEVVVEHEGTPSLIARSARARKYLGKPMLFAARFVSP